MSRTDKAMQMGALACECDLTRNNNPFEPDTAEAMAWEEGYTKAVHQWRAQLRADIADQYGDEAADYV